MIAGVETFDIKDIVDTVKHPCVYVFFDTCALLYLLKIETHQNSKNLEIFSKYEELLRLINDKYIIPLASVMNYVELESNYNKNCDCFQMEYNKTKKAVQPILNFAETRGEIPVPIDYSALSSIDYAKDLYNQIVNQVCFLKERISYDRFAMIRVMQGIVPAHQKHEYKDAYIWKTCLDVKSKSQKGDHVFFLTINTEDFDMKDSKAKEQLLRDCGKKITILTDIKALIPQIKIKLGLPLP